jgi:hypothetical protein
MISGAVAANITLTPYEQCDNQADGSKDKEK